MNRFILIALVLTACATPPTQQQIATAGQILAVAENAYLASNGGKSLTPQQGIDVANQLFGIFAQANAAQGTTPAAANIAQGSAIPAIGSAVQRALPNVPLTSAQSAQILVAAQALSKQ